MASFLFHDAFRTASITNHKDYQMISGRKNMIALTLLVLQRLVVAIEQRQIGWPAAWEVLTDELKRYEYQITPSGNITYNAPSGYHDDCVIALALANSERYQFKWSGAIRLVAPAPRAARLRARGRVLGW